MSFYITNMYFWLYLNFFKKTLDKYTFLVYNKSVPKRYTINIRRKQVRLTQESDYAIRMCCALSEAGGVVDTGELSEKVAITKSIALKVLRKLRTSGIVNSRKGTDGGYELALDPSKLSLCDIIEAIEGKIYISKCLDDCHFCSLNGYNKTCCKVHNTFNAINKDLLEKLTAVTVQSLTKK